MHSAAQHERGCSAGLRPAPAPSWSNSNSRSRFPAGSRGGSGCGGRCKYVHVSSVAASMRLTPPQPDPPRLRQFLAICSRSTPCVDESLSDNEINWGQIRFPKENGSDPMTPRDSRTYPTVTGNCQRRDGAGLRGVRGMDAAAKPPGVRALCLRSTASQAPERTAASGWAGLGVYGVPAIRHRPAQHTDNPEPLWLWLWLWLLPWLTAGAGRSPAGPPSPAHENDFTDFSKPSSLRHASTILRSSMRPRATHAKKRPPIA
ncbi:hypothetical protein SAMN02744786_3975 [Stenotrophomonas sp. CC120222-04]|nr:hypothetical protein SAMN02744786_3975 [Stenotrophomonas sp. CC120222-04]